MRLRTRFRFLTALFALVPASAITADSAAPATATKPSAATSPYEISSAPIPETPIDKFVFARLQKLNIEPANPCSDAVFVRRVFLDTIGTVPTAQETRDFLADSRTNKRAALIDRLLERDEFADYWTMKWADLLRIKAEFPINLWPNAVQSYYRWIHTSVKSNKPYDQFARELLTASGSNFRDPPVNFYRAVQSKEPGGIAQAVALTFMGCRAENWPKDQLSGMAGFFARVGFKSTAEWKEEIVFFDTSKPIGDQTAVFPDGTVAHLSADRDPREDFTDWLVVPRNPWFTRNIANRTWSWLLGRGIIHEPDDIRPDNPATNPELLAYLERELVAANYDLKHLFRLILNSRTYQLSSIPQSQSPNGPANFAAYPLRRLEAEVLADAFCQITGTTEKYSSPIPEPFTFIPDNQRSITLADGSTTSSFLELFGRPPRDTGWESERNNRPSSAQALHLLNSSHIQKKMEQGRRLQEILNARRSVKDIINDLYLTILSRYPTDDELKIATSLIAASPKQQRHDALMDISWALLNSAEFLYRH